MKTFVLIVFVLNVLGGDNLRKYPLVGSKRPSLVSILTELQVKLASGGSLDTTISFLDNLRGSINEEQIRHDQLYTDQKNQCGVELELRAKDIKDAEQVLNRAGEQLDNCQSISKKAQQELENNLSNQKTTDTDVKILESIRQEGSRLFEIKKMDHVDALRSLQESMKILDSFQGGSASLAQLSQVSLKLIQDSMKMKTTSTMAAISGIFSQVLLSNGGQAEVFEKLKLMLQNLEQSMYNNLQKYQEEEDQAISEYDERHTHLSDYYANLKITENKLRDHVGNMEICQDQQSAIIENARGKKIRNSEIFDSAGRMCVDFQQEYEKATQVRRQELELVGKVRERIISKSQGYGGDDY